MLVIGLGHKARHGKDFTAKKMLLHAASTLGKVARIYGFADALKAHCRVAYGMTTKDAPLLQMVGTDLYRRINPNIWVDVLVQTLKEQRPDIALITDVRFPNEAEAVKKLGGYCVKVSRYREDGSLWVAEDRSPDHPSETALDSYDGWDYEIKNLSGELDMLTAHARWTLDYFWMKGVRPNEPNERLRHIREEANRGMW